LGSKHARLRDIWVKELGSLPQDLAPPEMLQVRSCRRVLRHALAARDAGLQPALQQLAREFEEEEGGGDESSDLGNSDGDCGGGGGDDDDGDWNWSA
jgi:hypothetical protein